MCKIFQQKYLILIQISDRRLLREITSLKVKTIPPLFQSLIRFTLKFSLSLKTFVVLGVLEKLIKDNH